MSVFRTDEHCGQLFLRNEEVFDQGYGSFYILGSEVKNVMISDIPKGIRIDLCDLVVGSDDLCGRNPDANFEKTSEDVLIAHMKTVFIPPTEDTEGEALLEFFNQAIESGKRSLDLLRDSKRLLSINHDIFDGIAYLSYTLELYDQTFSEAEEFLIQIDEQVSGAYEMPKLFICHASEDKDPFVDKLASELDKRAMYAWYDKHEILVGDSIVRKINEGLSSSDYFIAVLSPSSVIKPWVQREMDSTLHRCLNGDGIRLLPILLEPCDIPPLWGDFKYADFTKSFEQGMKDLMSAIRAYNKSTGD